MSVTIFILGASDINLADDGTTNSDQDESEGAVETATSVVSFQQLEIDIADNEDEYEDLGDTQVPITGTANDCAASIVSTNCQEQDAITSNQESVFYEGQGGLLAMESKVGEMTLEENQELIDGTAAHDAEPVASFAHGGQDMIIDNQDPVAHQSNDDGLLAVEQGTDSLHEDGLAEKDLIHSNMNLRYQIEKNRRLAFRDELKDRFDLMFKQIQHEFNQLEEENSILLAKQSEILDSVKSNRIDQNQQKAAFNEVT